MENNTKDGKKSVSNQILTEVREEIDLSIVDSLSAIRLPSEYVDTSFENKFEL